MKRKENEKRKRWEGEQVKEGEGGVSSVKNEKYFLIYDNFI